MTTNEFIDLIARSGLAEASQVEDACSRTPAGLQFRSYVDAELLSNTLITTGVLARWQANLLLEGKWKGFFLGEYKLLELLPATSKGQSRIAEHLPTSSHTIITVTRSASQAGAPRWE